MTRFPGQYIATAALLLLPAATLAAAPTGASTCENLSKLSLPNVTISSAQTIAAGAFTPPPAPGPFGPNPALFKSLPQFCRVMATLTPSSDSDITVEVWLPTSGWNNDFQAIGNGGWNGTVGYAAIEKSYGSLIDASDPNMKPFFAHNGKLLMYHGWSDQAIAPRNSINYYQSVVKNLGGEANASSDVRLFMAPGMAHCAGGEGPNDFDKMTAIRDWLEHGKAPEILIASHAAKGVVDRTRPLCVYPKVAKYKESGSIDDAANFTCALP